MISQLDGDERENEVRWNGMEWRQTVLAPRRCMIPCPALPAILSCTLAVAVVSGERERSAVQTRVRVKDEMAITSEADLLYQATATRL